MRIILFLSVIIGFSGNILYGKQYKQKKIVLKREIKWAKIIDSDTLLKKNPKKKIFILIYTNWCPYCKKMEIKTLNHPEVVEYINKNYIPLKINSETKHTLTYKGKKYPYLENFGINSLVYYLLDGKMSYPSVLFIDQKGKTSILRGFINYKKFITYLKSPY